MTPPADQNTGREGGRRKGDDVERIARAFHGWYESHAYRRGWETQEATRTDFDNLPAENRETMLHTVRSLLEARIIAPVKDEVPEQHPDIQGLEEELEERADQADRWYDGSKTASGKAHSAGLSGAFRVCIGLVRDHFSREGER